MVQLARDTQTDGAPAPREFFRFRFTRQRTDPSSVSSFQIHLEPYGALFRDEVWHTASEVRSERQDGISIVTAGTYLAAHIEMPVQRDDDFVEISRAAYCRLLALLRERGFSFLARTWNFFPQINAGDGDLERYKLFVSGRAVAFADFGFGHDTYPAATAIGTDSGTPFTVTAIATRRQGAMLGNPRQTDPFTYPRRYGPTSPSFSRAVLLNVGGQHKVLISGTASIVGHESAHPQDPVKQLAETLRNLDELIRHAAGTIGAPPPPLSQIAPFLRVYVRPTAYTLELLDVLRSFFGAHHEPLVLRGAVCRSELDIEIEAVCEF